MAARKSEMREVTYRQTTMGSRDRTRPSSSFQEVRPRFGRATRRSRHCFRALSPAAWRSGRTRFAAASTAARRRRREVAEVPNRRQVSRARFLACVCHPCALCAPHHDSLGLVCSGTVLARCHSYREVCVSFMRQANSSKSRRLLATSFTAEQMDDVSLGSCLLVSYSR